MKNKSSNINVTINNSNINLIDNNTTFTDLIDILRKRPEASRAVMVETWEKEHEGQEARPDGSGNKETPASHGDITGGGDALEKSSRRPGVVQLRENETLIAMYENGAGGTLEVFSNGYSIYDNGDRRTVLWTSDCGKTTYHFVKLRDSEKDASDDPGSIIKQKVEIGEDFLGDKPWMLALTIAGEDSIERNLEHPKSKGTTSDLEVEEEWEKKGSHKWASGACFENPEDAYLKKEAAQERRRELTERQRLVYTLYYEEEMKQQDIAHKLGISQPAVNKLLEKCHKRIRAYEEKNI